MCASMSSSAISACPTCFLVLVHADGTSLRRLSVLETVVDVGGLPAGVLPVLDVLREEGKIVIGPVVRWFSGSGGDKLWVVDGVLWRIKAKFGNW